jgi:hypothetical protein
VILIIEVGQALAPVVDDLLGVLVERELAYGLAHVVARGTVVADLRFVPRSIEDYGLICQRIFEQVESVSWRYEAFRRSHLTDVLYRFITTCVLRRTSTITDSDATNYINIGYAGALANIIINWLEEGCATPRNQVSEAMVSIIFPRSDTLERLRTGVPVALS